MARLLSYHDPNFPVVAGMSVGMALGIKDATSNSTKWNKGWGMELSVVLNIVYLLKQLHFKSDSNIMFVL